MSILTVKPQGPHRNGVPTGPLLDLVSEFSTATGYVRHTGRSIVFLSTAMNTWAPKLKMIPITITHKKVNT